jgi:hypothetical protein
VASRPPTGGRGFARTSGGGRRGAGGGRGCSRAAPCSRRPGSLLARPRRWAAGLGDGGAARARRALLPGARRVAGPPSREPVRPDHPRQRPLHRRRAPRRAAGVVVRRRLRPDALLPVRGGRRRLAPDGARRLRAVRGGGLPALQALVRRVLLPAPPRRDARRRRPLLRRLDAGGASARSRSCAASATASCPPTCRSSSAAAPPLGRARARLPALPPRPLRRVQPALRPGHAVRHPVRRPHRVDPDVAAAAGALGVRLEGGAGVARGAADRDFLRPRDWLATL